LVNLGDDEDSIQLELSATTTPYTSVHREGKRIAILSPDKCCYLSDGDTIHFTTVMTSIMVSLSPDLQVSSSQPTENETALLANVTTSNVLNTVLNTVGTPNMSVPEAIEETPHAVIPSPEAQEEDADIVVHADACDDATETESEHPESPLHQPSINAIVQKPKKRSLESEDRIDGPIAKKSRTLSREGSEEAESKVSANLFRCVQMKPVY
jgi:hypothetical protein